MENIQNKQGISEITITKKLKMYCPLGKDTYKAEITATFAPDSVYMDYCVLDAFLDGMKGRSYIIEDAVKVVYDYIEAQIHPKSLQVTVKGMSRVHMPAVVTKRS